MDKEAMKKLQASVEKCIEELGKKDTVTPAETKAGLDGMQLRDFLKREIENCKMQEENEYAERGYSGANHPYRQYHITSYGQPHMYNYPMMAHNDGYSGDYGVEGWYRSNNGGSYCPDPYYYDGMSERSHGRGYSRHSIGDRMVAMMEREMDNTDSSYEKEEIRKFIRMIRSAAD